MPLVSIAEEDHRALLKLTAVRAWPKLFDLIETPMSPIYSRVASSTQPDYLARINQPTSR
jgi:hypothetical protein